MAIASKTQDRDGQHSELTKIRTQQEEGRSELERQREVLYKLTQQISATEQTLNRVRERERGREEEGKGKESKDGNMRERNGGKEIVGFFTCNGEEKEGGSLFNSFSIIVHSYASIMSKLYRAGMTLDYSLLKGMKRSASSMRKSMFKVEDSIHNKCEQ